MRLKTRDGQGLLLVLVLQRRAGPCSPAIILVSLVMLTGVVRTKFLSARLSAGHSSPFTSEDCECNLKDRPKFLAPP
jgi:hypothetical protein